MKYAIDRYIVGTEKEVSAKEFDDIYIPNRRERFFCPECGEIVFFRNKGGKKPSQFYHQEKTEKTPECDKRVDGRSELSLSQRVGLPVYITRTKTNYYNLCIGFPAFSEKILDSELNGNCWICITDGVHHRDIQLNHTNFIENEITLVPINFIPDNEKNFKIKLSGNNDLYLEQIKRKLSDYADGFNTYGALFSYNENGGKKIRRGDSISTYKYYYAVVKFKYSMPSMQEIYSEVQGSFRIGSELFKVLKIEIRVSVEDKTSFNRISVFLKNYFGVWLLECLPELIPIWPPAVQRECLIPVDERTTLTCAVSSGNIKPDVYIYSDRNVQKKDIDYSENDVDIVKINVCSTPITLSVDRKYVGREVSIISKDLPTSHHKYQIHLKDKVGKVFSWEEITPDLFSKELFISSNAKIEMIIGTNQKFCKRIDIKEEITPLPVDKNCIELFFVTENAVVMHFLVKSNTVFNIDYKNYERLVSSANLGVMVPIPRWCVAMLDRFKRKHENEIYKLVLSSFCHGKIHLELLKQLWMMDSHKRK